jgi:hypothetical protein
VTPGEAALRALYRPEEQGEVRYENGVRRIVPPAG